MTMEQAKTFLEVLLEDMERFKDMQRSEDKFAATMANEVARRDKLNKQLIHEVKEPSRDNHF